MKLFERAKEIGLKHVTDWLPGGKREGAEWSCINPTRADNNRGSFKVNLKSGRWGEFNGDGAGNDVVSLYAYLNRDRLVGAASKYKNVEGGIQAEAAKEILNKYDPSYFPGSDDDFTPAYTETGRWAGYWFVAKGMADPPELDTGWAEKLWGEKSGEWGFMRYVGNELRTVMKVVRFVKGGKKDDRPFTLWTNGTETKWRAKRGFEKGKVPLYNEYLLDERPNDEFALYEGQKCGSAACGHEISLKYIPIAFYGGAGNFDQTDWSPLVGRSGVAWPDGDGAGRRAILKLKELDVSYRLVRTPAGKPKGWDIADAIEDGTDIMALVDGAKESASPEQDYLDDFKPPFRIVGTSSTNVFFYTKETMQVMSYKKSSLGKAQMMTLMPRPMWGDMFQKDGGGTAWDAATDWVLRTSAKRPIFATSLIRGAGAWIDRGRVAVNTGNGILCGGRSHGLFEFESEYVYERTAELPYTLEDPNKSAGELLDICRSLQWMKKESAYMLAGWLLLAPFGGALEWRSHVWLNGPKGSGKTWVIQNIIVPMLHGFAVNAQGSSTAAGVRQSIGKGTRPFICDEMEGDDKRQAELIQDKLTMARQSSSGAENAAGMLQGTADGDGTEYRYQSMWLAASIGVTLRHGADADRWSLLTLANPKKIAQDKRAEMFRALKVKCEVMTGAWVSGVHARTLGMMDKILEAIEIFAVQTAEITGTRRSGDQIGTLMAGAYMCNHDEVPTAGEAAAWLGEFDIAKMALDADKGDDERQILDVILSHTIEVNSGVERARYSIGSLLAYWFAEETMIDIDGVDKNTFIIKDLSIIRSSLSECGIKPIKDNGGYVQVAIQHPALKAVLRDTPWVENYGDLLSQLDFCGEVEGPARFGGVQKRYRKLGAPDVLGFVPF